MSTDVPNEDQPSHEHIADTWRWRQDGASWIASLASPDGNAAVARWMADTTDGLLDDFAPLARVRTAMVLAGDGPRHLTRRPDESYASFRQRLAGSIRQCPLPVTFVELELDVRVWSRTKDSPDRPQLVWLSYPGFTLGVHLDDSAWVVFSLENTLFSAFTYPERGPNPLHPLNQPLLEAALTRLRARATGPLDREGELPGAFEFGFSAEADDY